MFYWLDFPHKPSRCQIDFLPVGLFVVSEVWIRHFDEIYLTTHFFRSTASLFVICFNVNVNLYLFYVCVIFFIFYFILLHALVYPDEFTTSFFS